MAWGLACDEHAYWARTSIECLMRLARSDFDCLSGVKDEGLPFDFEGQSTVEDVEELQCMEVIVATLTCAGWHELFDDAEFGSLNQVPAVAVCPVWASPLVVFG